MNENTRSKSPPPQGPKVKWIKKQQCRGADKARHSEAPPMSADAWRAAHSVFGVDWRGHLRESANLRSFLIGSLRTLSRVQIVSKSVLVRNNLPTVIAEKEAKGFGRGAAIAV